MLFSVGFLAIFLIGGLSGVMVAVMPFDLQVTDSYFIVAHFHYVLNGAVVFPIFGAVYYWAPKATGRMLSERWGKISFWTMFVGFNLTFFPMHILGLEGMPRRVSTYQAGLGWDLPNLLATIGGFVFGLGTAFTLFNYLWSRRHGEPAGANPWHADTLEWSTSSPPPEYDFAEIPRVSSRNPLWDDRPFEVATTDAPTAQATVGLAPDATERHLMPMVDGMEALPHDVLAIPHQTYVPLIAAGGILVFFLGMLISAALVGVVGVGLTLVGVVMWTWRAREDER
jgi:heme/copper-type cytochrome/quinol oxidase subunit 1